MSIGKFFILAILLPMATIYLTLTLKGQQDTIFGFGNESQQQSLNSLNFSSSTDDTPDTNSESDFYYEDGESSEIVNGESNVEDDTFESIEDLIKFKKNKANNIVNNQDDVEPIDKEIAIFQTDKKDKAETNAIIINSNTITNSGKSTSTKNITKPKVNKSSENKTKTKKVKSKRAKNNKIKTKNRNVAKIKKTKVKTKNPSKVKQNKPVKTANKKVKSKKVTFVIKKPTKQVILTNKKSVKKSAQKNKPKESNYFESAFDEGNDIDEEEDVISANESTTPISESTESVKPDESQRFSSNPCSGRSARYIARCRKK